MPTAVYLLCDSNKAYVSTVPAGADSLLYMCRTCGEVWARCVVEDSVWSVIHTPCTQHTHTSALDWTQIPGSLLYWTGVASQHALWAAAATIDYFPQELFCRELLLHLTLLTKEIAA